MTGVRRFVVAFVAIAGAASASIEPAASNDEGPWKSICPRALPVLGL